MNRYYMVFDLSKKVSDIKHSYYFMCKTNDNIFGYVMGFAKGNNADLVDIRLFCFDNKKEYDASYQNWLKQVKF